MPSALRPPRRINTDVQPGNDRLSLMGSFTLPAGVPFVSLAPGSDGARIVLEADDGTRRVDLSLPGGA